MLPGRPSPHSNQHAALQADKAKYQETVSSRIPQRSRMGWQRRPASSSMRPNEKFLLNGSDSSGSLPVDSSLRLALSTTRRRPGWRLQECFIVACCRTPGPSKCNATVRCCRYRRFVGTDAGKRGSPAEMDRRRQTCRTTYVRQGPPRIQNERSETPNGSLGRQIYGLVAVGGFPRAVTRT